MSHRPSRMRDLGEKAYLGALLPTLHVDRRFVNGFGHDASIIDVGLPELNLVLKIDRAAKPIASLNGWSDFRVWGRMAVTANCSDILAIGGSPVGFMLSVTVPGDLPAQTVNEIVAGAAEECEAQDVAFLGGDTKEGSGINIVGTAVGTIEKSRRFDRHAASCGDLLVLAGTVGGFLGAYWTCTRSSEPRADALRYLAKPRAAWREAEAIAKVGGVRSACDLSDGLSSSAASLMSPGLGAHLEFDKIPFHPLALESADSRGVDVLPYAFGVGDWGILYAVDPAAKPDIEELRARGLEIAVIGKVVAEEGVHLMRGARFEVSVMENEHFRHRMEDQGDYFDVHERNVILNLARSPR